MRLTLRTLLAYRDGVLGPKDRALLENKLKESSTAREISQRIDQSLRNPKLAPIPVDAKEPGFDANQIAEYLDDTIPTEQIPELERRCLENNALLSEVGSCHSILSKALTESVEIPDVLRARVRALPSNPEQGLGSLRMQRLAGEGSGQATPAHPAASAGGSSENLAVRSVPVNESVTKSTRETLARASVRAAPAEPSGRGIELSDSSGVQVPEYLLGSDRSWMRSALMVAALALALLVVSILAIGPVERIGYLLGPAKTQTELAKGNSTTPSAQPEPTPNVKLKPIDAPEVTANKANLPSADSESPSPKMDVPAGDVKNGPDEPSVPDPPPAATPKETNGASGSASVQWLPASEEASRAVLLVCETPDEESPKWELATAGQESKKGHWIVPFAYRTELLLGKGVRAIVCGDTEVIGIESVSPGPSEGDSSQAAPRSTTPQVEIPYGQMVLFPKGEAKELLVKTSVGTLEVFFGDEQGSCGLEIGSRWKNWTVMPGEPFDPKTNAPPLAVSPYIGVIGIQGATTIRLNRGGDAELPADFIELDVGDFARIGEDGTVGVSAISNTPPWLRANIERPIDQLAANDIGKQIRSEESENIGDVLRELARHRKSETASMATRILCQIGDFQPLFGEEGLFATKGNFSHSGTWINKIPNFLYSSPRASQFLESASEKLGDKVAGKIRLMVPMSDEQLAAGGEKLLVDTLSSPSLDDRVLAIHQLVAITQTSLGFHPERPSNDAVQNWKKKLGKSEIRFTTDTQ